MPLVDHPATDRAPQYKLRILVVDDQWVARSALRTAFDKLSLPFSVIDAETGEEALSIMRNIKVSIIFCDVHLPGISGPEALSQAYGNSLDRPFMVLMSAQGSEKVREIGRKVGVYEFLQKPFRPNQVLAAFAAFQRISEPINVLLVDDSSVARALMTRILARSQFHIALKQAASGTEAIGLAQAETFDVVFLDLNMPGISGLDAAGLLLQVNPRAQIVIVSTDRQTEIAETAQFSGAFAFLRKPFDEKDVDAVLHSAFDLVRPSLARDTHAIFARTGKADQNSPAKDRKPVPAA